MGLRPTAQLPRSVTEHSADAVSTGIKCPKAGTNKGLSVLDPAKPRDLRGRQPDHHRGVNRKHNERMGVLLR